jgi:SSS family solute:Na+ symporter/sodium/pantothenate symporter
MLAALAALLAWLILEAGGLAGLTEAILALRPELAAVPSAAERVNWASTIVLMGLASVVYPQAIQRVYAASSGRTLGRSLALMSFMPLATALVVTLIGWAAIPRLAALGDVEADRLMPLLLEQWAALSPVGALLGVLVFLGALAAIMSTADSVLLSLGSVVAEDLLGASRLAADTTRLGKRIAAGVMLAMAGLALVARDITLWGLIELKMEILIQCVPAFLLALHWRRLAAGPLLAGAALGTAVAVAGVLAGVSRVGGVHTGVLGLLLNAAVAAAGSWLAPHGERGEPDWTHRGA